MAEWLRMEASESFGEPRVQLLESLLDELIISSVINQL